MTVEEQLKQEIAMLMPYRDSAMRMQGAFNRIKIELRTTKRALWLARAERASSEKSHYYIMSVYCEPHSNKQKCMKRIAFTWEKVERKCREKAEQYR